MSSERPRDRGDSIKVERALALLPEVETLAPLRASLLAASHGDLLAGRYSTLGKRSVRLVELRSRQSGALVEASLHMRQLCDAAMEALEFAVDEDQPSAVRALLGAAEIEESAGHLHQALAWSDSALRAAKGLRERYPEIEALYRSGRIEASRGRWNESIRAHRRGLDLAEAESDARAAARACLGLGDAYLARSDWEAARQWFERGLGSAGPGTHLEARLLLRLSEALLGSDDLAGAGTHLDQAQAGFRILQDSLGLARTLVTSARLEARRSRPHEASVRLREAIDLAQRDGLPPAFEGEVRLEVSRLHAEEKRPVEAELEARQVEEIALRHELPTLLVRAYLLLGELRGREGDDTGFVFFEKALELCRGSESRPRLEAEAFRAYGLFRKELGDEDEAGVYLARSLEIRLALDGGPASGSPLSPKRGITPKNPASK